MNPGYYRPAKPCARTGGPTAGAGRFRHIALIATVLVAGAALAQRRFGGGEGGYVPANVRTAREVESHSTGTPNWTNDAPFVKDVFTFTRIKYNTQGRVRGWGYQRWTIDFPDSDLNLSHRVQQMTSMKVDPDARVMWLTDNELKRYPWLFAAEPGDLLLSEEEVVALRKHLLNGGFMMFDDFWGDYQYQIFYEQIKRVFPDREPQELPMEHPIFHSVFDIKLTKNQMQVPNFGIGENSKYNPGVTWEDYHGGNCRDVHFKGIFDDKGRMMVFIAHNTDNGDGWEREGEHEYFFKEFSEKKAFPLGINVIFYAMTH